MRFKIRNLCRDETGAAAIEFAIVASVFFLLFIGIIEFGLYMMTEVALESAVGQAGRVAALGQTSGGDDMVTTVKKVVLQKAGGLLNSQSIVFTANTVAKGGAPKQDICLEDVNNPTPPSCSHYLDVDGIPGYAPPSQNYSVGSAGDVVEIRASYPWRVQFPMMQQFFGSEGSLLISATTVVKNEPY